MDYFHIARQFVTWNTECAITLLKHIIKPIYFCDFFLRSCQAVARLFPHLIDQFEILPRSENKNTTKLNTLKHHLSTYHYAITYLLSTHLVSRYGSNGKNVSRGLVLVERESPPTELLTTGNMQRLFRSMIV